MKATNNKLNSNSETYKTIFIYQKISGDVEIGTSSFTSKNSKIINNDCSGNLLKVSSSKWGTSGKNGGTVTLNAKNQKISGNLLIDNISTLDLSFNLESSSSISLTGDSYITSLENADSTNSNINFNGYKLYVNGTAIN